MPEKQLTPNLRTYYLDTSTLSHAQNAAAGDASVPRELAQLAPWIERIAANGNLCISFVHVGECSDGEPAEGDRFAAWIDSLPFVWAMSTEETERAEVDAHVRTSLGLAPVRVQPFALRGRTMSEMVAVVRKLGWDPVRRLGFDQTSMVRQDIAEIVAAEVSEEALAEKRAYAARVVIRQLAAEAHDRLMERGDREYASVQVGQTVQDRLVELFEREPTSFRTLRMSLAGAQELGRNALERKAGSRTERSQLRGFAGDQLHAMAGAAYCDVFTCDGPTARWVGPMRAQFGLAPPVVLRGHIRGAAGFVDDLLAS